MMSSSYSRYGAVINGAFLGKWVGRLFLTEDWAKMKQKFESSRLDYRLTVCLSVLSVWFTRLTTGIVWPWQKLINLTWLQPGPASKNGQARSQPPMSRCPACSMAAPGASRRHSGGHAVTSPCRVLHWTFYFAFCALFCIIVSEMQFFCLSMFFATGFFKLTTLLIVKRIFMPFCTDNLLLAKT